MSLQKAERLRLTVLQAQVEPHFSSIPWRGSSLVFLTDPQRAAQTIDALEAAARDAAEAASGDRRCAVDAR